MQAKLHLVKGNPKGKEVEIPEGTLTIGRAEDRDLIIASTRVSRQHCEITNTAEGLTIRDNASGNGTIVNAKKIQEQTLEAGDHVTVGPLTFVVEIDGVKERARPAAPEPAAAPAKPKPKKKKKKRRAPATEDDILASLEMMSAGPKGANENADDDEDEDVLEISDDDLLE